MKLQKLPLFALLASAAATSALVFQATGQEYPAPVTIQKSEVRLLFAQPFFLDDSYAHAWRSDQPTASAGYLIAVSADQDVLPVRQVHNPLLFVGDMPVERINEASASGVYIGLVPSAVDANGELTLDLTEAPIHWAKPDVLPEALTPAKAQAVLAEAVTSGAVAQRADLVEQAFEEAGGAVYLPNHGMLYRYAADVIERYSPTETDLVSGLRAPLVR
ncbi:MAG: hypothetical protein AAF682_15565 [Planctomycetota bacterium]